LPQRTPVCIFAKPPLPGQVKTRLAPAVGVRGAARLAEAFLVDTVELVRSRPWTLPALATTGALSATLLRRIRPLPLLSQGDGDLGERMERVLRRLLRRSGPRPAAMLLGADCPALLPEALDHARAALEGHDAVLGPAEDGGYYLIGLRRCPAGLLRGLPWSSSATLQATAERLERVGLTVALGPPAFDVDRPEDVVRLRELLGRDPGRAPATHAVLQALTEPPCASEEESP